MTLTGKNVITLKKLTAENSITPVVEWVNLIRFLFGV